MVRYRVPDRALELWLSLLVPHGSCPEEPIYYLSGTEQYSVTGETGSEKLMLSNSGGGTLTLDAVPAVGLDTDQRDWSLTNIVDFKPRPSGLHTNVSVAGEAVAGATVTLSFREDRIKGSAGCNTYRASLETNGEVIEIGPPSTPSGSLSGSQCTHLPSIDEIMEQEERYLSLLPQMTGIRIYDEHLVIMYTDTEVYLIFKSGKP